MDTCSINTLRTSLLYWTIIEAACARGLKMLDLGRSKYGSGTYDFKAQLRCKPLAVTKWIGPRLIRYIAWRRHYGRLHRIRPLHMIDRPMDW